MATSLSYYWHIKSKNVYQVLYKATLESDLAEVVVYQDYYDKNKIWVRPSSEFYDGRFIAVKRNPERYNFGKDWITLNE